MSECMLIPKISIVVPLYNKENLVDRALDSVFHQTFQDFEVIIVNDGSTDESRSRAEEFIKRAGWDSSKAIIIDQQNLGVSAARNRGIEEAKFDLIAFLDADDEWMPCFLETILRLRETFLTCEVFATNYVCVESEEKSYASRLHGIPPTPWEGVLYDYFAIAAKSDPPVWSSAVSVTKQAIMAVSGFPVGVTSGEDLLTWAKLAVKYDIAYSSTPLAKYHISREGLLNPRKPQHPDIVGQGLVDLLKVVDNPIKRSLKTYISMWHKMRANCYLALGAHQMALSDVIKSLHFDKTRWKLYLYFCLAMFPFRYSILFSKVRNYLRMI